MGRVVIVPGAPSDGGAPLARVAESAGLWPALERRCEERGQPAADLPILIKVCAAGFAADDALGTSPPLVHHLLDLLHGRGYRRVAIADGPDGTERWLHHRSARERAGRLGYLDATPGGLTPTFVDLSEAPSPGPFDAGSVLHGAALSRHWLDAGFRIVFAKHRTDEIHGFAGTLDALPELIAGDRAYQAGARRDPGEVCTSLLQAAPPDFCLLDGLVANHGSFGRTLSNPLEAGSLYAGTSAAEVDWAAAVRTGMDPFRSPLLAAAVGRDGAVPSPEVDGDLAPIRGWRGPSPALQDAVRRLVPHAAVFQLVQQVLPRVDRALFPFRDRALDVASSSLGSALLWADASPVGQAAASGLLQQLATACDVGEALDLLGARRLVRQRQVSLELDLTRYRPEDYEAVAGYLEPLEALVEAMPPGEDGLRWRMIDGSVLFGGARVLDAPYDKFVRRVDLGRAVEVMNEFSGGRRVVVKQDGEGRPIHQAERTTFLPQPNFLALSGGKPIDVCKLELLRYGPDQRVIFWRTVDSANGSAAFDDGSVRLSRTGDGRTEVRIVARQRFSLPPLWEAARLDLNPLVKDPIVAWSYRRYFRNTLANLERMYCGQPFLAGQPWPEEPPEDAARLLESAGKVTERVRASLPVRAAPKPVEDDRGFRHFAGGNGAAEGTGNGERPLVRALGSLAASAIGLATEVVRAVRHDLEAGRPGRNGGTGDS